jgi:transcriptional regulator with XRE-family HTH domain
MNKNKAKIHAHILTRIRKNQELKLALASKLGKSYETIVRWLRENNPMLTTVDSIELISHFLKIEKEEITNMPEYQEAP